MRLLAVADVYEALTSPRPCRAAFTSDQALSVIADDVPKRFDAESFLLLPRLLAGDTTQSAAVAASRATAVFRARRAVGG
jgi:HD-GYP domain-containing protein (c-di-GMP phosphodiesterase class II)